MAAGNSTFRATLFGVILMGCAVQQEGSGPFNDTGGAAAFAGAASGGTSAASGGTATGGVTGTGGSASGGDSSGGNASGGTSSGGSATGGASSGGTSSGGTSSGGTSSGGSTASGGTSSGGSTASGGTGGTTSAACTGIDVWHAGTYTEGDVVQSTCSGANASPCPEGETHRFSCKAWPYSGWCGQRQPGVGQAWADAWNDLGRCTSSNTGGTGGTSSGGTSSGGTSSGGTSSGGTSSGGTSSGGTSSGGTGGTGTGTSLCGVLTSALFDQIFPAKNRTAVYTYAGLLQAAAAFPTFASSSDATTCKRELAAFFANVAWETGELHYAEQIAKAAYCSSQSGCPCDPNDSSHWYYGRGALQLSWNYNYCAATSALGVDLHADPGRIATDPTLVWETGIWFWMTNEGAGSQTCHAAMTGGGGFGETIRTINGGQECNQGGYNGNDAVRGRVDYFVAYCALLGVDPGGSVTDLDC